MSQRGMPPRSELLGDEGCALVTGPPLQTRHRLQGRHSYATPYIRHDRYVEIGVRCRIGFTVCITIHTMFRMYMYSIRAGVCVGCMVWRVSHIRNMHRVCIRADVSATGHCAASASIHTRLRGGGMCNRAPRTTGVCNRASRVRPLSASVRAMVGIPGMVVLQPGPVAYGALQRVRATGSAFRVPPSLHEKRPVATGRMVASCNRASLWRIESGDVQRVDDDRMIHR